MFVLILVLLIGLGIAYFATQNTAGVNITLANNTFEGVSLYLIVLGSLLLGIFMSWLISLVDSVSSFLNMHGKDTAIKDSEKYIQTLKQKNHDLELENARLKGEKTAAEKTPQKSPNLAGA
jgi:uncharacterized protein HemY